MTLFTQLRHFWAPPLPARKHAALLLLDTEKELLAARLTLIQQKSLVACLEMEVEVLRQSAGVDNSVDPG